MNKKKLTGAFAVMVAVIVAISAVYITFWWQTKEKEEPLPLALVKFEIENSSYLEITCEIAQTPKERSYGLMNRNEMEEDKGMLFVYDNPQDLSFWMKNTLIPLDIIFIDEYRLVLNVEEALVEPNMPDNELTRYHSSGPAKWVVEINMGLSASNGIKTGTPVTIEYLD